MLKRILKSNIFKNFSYLSLAEIISKGIGFFVMAYVARVLGPENFGKLGFAQACVSYFGLIVNLGLDVHGAREIAKERNKAKEILSNIVSMKVFLFCLAYVILFISVSLLPKDNYTKKVILFYGLTLLISIFTIDWFFQGFENFKLIAVGRIISSVVYASLVFAFIKYPNQLFELIGFQVVSGLLGTIVLWFFALRFFSFKEVIFQKWKQLAKTGIILASSFFMISIYYNLDKVMIGLWFPDKYVGWYDAAYNIMLPLIQTDLGIFLFLNLLVFCSILQYWVSQ